MLPPGPRVPPPSGLPKTFPLQRQSDAWDVKRCRDYCPWPGSRPSEYERFAVPHQSCLFLRIATAEGCSISTIGQRSSRCPFSAPCPMQEDCAPSAAMVVATAVPASHASQRRRHRLEVDDSTRLRCVFLASEQRRGQARLGRFSYHGRPPRPCKDERQARQLMALCPWGAKSFGAGTRHCDRLLLAPSPLNRCLHVTEERHHYLSRRMPSPMHHSRNQRHGQVPLQQNRPSASICRECAVA